MMFPLSTKSPKCVKEMECIDSTRYRLFFNTCRQAFVCLHNQPE